MSKINQWLRAKEKLLLVVVCVVLMIVWVVGPAIGSLFGQSPLPDGRIFGKRVPGAKVFHLGKSLVWLTGRRLRENRDLPFALAWDTLIHAEEAKRFGLAVSEAELREALKARFPVQGGEGFDEGGYVAFLRRGGIAKRDFEETLRAVLLAQKVKVVVADSANLTTEEAWLWYSRESEKVKARYVQVRAEDLAPLVTVTEEELKGFYERHAESDPLLRESRGVGYLEPEKIRIEYVMAPQSGFTEKVVVTERQIRAYYEENKERYRRAGTPSLTGAGGAKAPVEYRPAAEVADGIERTLRREEARHLAGEVLKKASEDAWAMAAVELGAEESRSADLKGIAKQYGLKYRATDFFSADEVGTVVPGAYELRKEGFGQGTRSIGRPRATLTANEGPFLFQLLEIRPPNRADYEKVKDRVEKDLRLKEGMDAAVEIAAKAGSAGGLDAATAVVEEEIVALLKGLPEGARPAKEAKDFFSTGESSLFDRPQEFWGQKHHYRTGLPGRHNHGKFAEAAFGVKAGDVGVAIEEEGARAVYLLARTGVESADRTAFEEDVARIRRRLLDRKRAAVQETWMADLRRRAHPSKEAMEFLNLLPAWSGRKL